MLVPISRPALLCSKRPDPKDECQGACQTETAKNGDPSGLCKRQVARFVQILLRLCLPRTNPTGLGGLMDMATN
jgi:hypothetical protein